MYQIDFTKPIHIHFIGIGGISMSVNLQKISVRNCVTDEKCVRIANHRFVTLQPSS